MLKHPVNSHTSDDEDNEEEENENELINNNDVIVLENIEPPLNTKRTIIKTATKQTATQPPPSDLAFYYQVKYTTPTHPYKLTFL